VADQPREQAQRGLRLALVALAFIECAGAGLAFWQVRDGTAPLLPAHVQRFLAYAWVALTIAAALGAYALASAARGTGAARRVRAYLAGGGLASCAALAGIVTFWLVRVWPMLVVSLLVGVLGLVLAWPATLAESAPAAPPADATLR
jgi:hypothetical protein